MPIQPTGTGRVQTQTKTVLINYRDQMNVKIIMYHYVRKIRDSQYPGIKGLEIEGFRRQLDFFKCNFNVINAEDVIKYVKYGTHLPENSCLLTFDDGYKDHLTYVLPELLSRGLQGSFFPPVKPVMERELLDVNRIHYILASTEHKSKLVNHVENLCVEHGISALELSSLKSKYAIPSRYDSSEVNYIKKLLQHALPEGIRKSISSELFRVYVNRTETEFADNLYLTFDDVKTLIKSGMYIGSHGYRHVWLDKETIESQTLEIENSLKFLGDVGATTVDWIMCYPFGGYNVHTLDILTRYNCIAGITTKVGLARLSRERSLELPRFNTNDYQQ